MIEALLTELIAALTNNTAAMRELAASNRCVGVTELIVAPTPEPEAPKPAKTKAPAKAKSEVVAPEPEPAAIAEPAAAEPPAPETTDPIKLRAQLQEYLKSKIIDPEVGPAFKESFAAELAKRGFAKAISLPDDQLSGFFALARTW
jgi:hypothetical protein